MTRMTRRQAAKAGIRDGYDSDLEAELATYLRVFCVPAWEEGYHWDSDSKRHFDFAWPKSQPPIAVEVNGEAVHAHWEKQAEDAMKRNDAALANPRWIVLTFTGQMIRRNPAGCVDVIKAALGEG